MGENDPKSLKTDFLWNKWMCLIEKLAYPYEYFKRFNDYQKPVDNLKNENFFSKLKNKQPDDEEIERTEEIKKVLNKANEEEIIRINLKSEVLLLACVFENIIKVSIFDFGINPLYCVSLPGYTWQCGLKYTAINIQTLQDKDLILLLENKFRGGVSSIMADRHVKSVENKNIFFIDATNLYGHSMSQVLPYDGIGMRHGHPDFYMKKLREKFNPPDDSDIG